MNKLLRYILSFRTNQIITGSFWLTAGGLFVNLGNYLFNLVMGRFLTPADFGIISSLFSLTVIISLPSAVITTVTAKFAASFFASNERRKLIRLYQKMHIYTIGFSILLLIGLLSIGDVIGDFLNIRERQLIDLTVIIIVIGLVSSVIGGFLRGLLLFKLMTALGVLGVLMKLGFGWYLVAIGQGVFGILIAIIASSVITWIYLLWIMRSYMFETSTASFGLRKHIISFSYPTLAASAASTLFISSDIILVKHFFHEKEAGIFAATVIAGKAIFYLLIPMSTVLFSVVSQQIARKRSIVKDTRISLILTLIPGLGALAAYSFMPELIGRVFFPSQAYASITSYIGLYGLYAFLLSMVVLMLHFFLAMEKKQTTYIAFACSLLQIVLIILFHKTIGQVIIMSIITMVLLLSIYTPSFIRLSVRK